MTEWQVFGVIAAIVALFVTIGTPVIKLNSAVTTLSNQIKNFQECITELRDSNKSAHKRMWDKLDEQEKIINEIQKDIEVLKVK